MRLKLLLGLMFVLGGLYVGALYVGKQAAEEGVVQWVAAMEEASGASIKHEGISVDAGWDFRYSARLEKPTFFGVGWMARNDGHLKVWIGEDQEHVMLSSDGDWLISQGALITELSGEWEHEIHTPGYNLIKGTGDAEEFYEAFRTMKVNFSNFALSIAPIDTPILVIEGGKIQIDREPRTEEDLWRFHLESTDFQGGQQWNYQTVDVQSGLNHLTQKWLKDKMSQLKQESENHTSIDGTLRTLPLLTTEGPIFPEGEMLSFEGRSDAKIPYYSSNSSYSGKGQFDGERLRFSKKDNGSSIAEIGLTPALRALVEEWVTEVIAPAKVNTMAEGQIQSGIVGMKEAIKQWIPEFADWGEIKTVLDFTVDTPTVLDVNQLIVSVRDMSIITDIAGLQLQGKFEGGVPRGTLKLMNYQVFVDGLMSRAEIIGPMAAVYKPALVATLKEMGGVEPEAEPKDIEIPISIEALDQFQVIMQKNLVGE